MINAIGLAQCSYSLGLMLCSCCCRPPQHAWASKLHRSSTEEYACISTSMCTSSSYCSYMSVCAGMRHSRRLAALAEAQPHSPSSAHRVKQKAHAGSAQAAQTDMQGDGTEPAAAYQAQSMTQPAALLQASTLEASANVLKGLVSLHPQ